MTREREDAQYMEEEYSPGILQVRNQVRFDSMRGEGAPQ